jgi:Pyridoxamine 5'-phosphate oxidase
MRWSDVEAQQPALARRLQQQLVAPGVLLVVTIRRDGTPRLSPVEPFVLDGALWLSMLWGSLKAADLKRDSRLLVHSVVTGRDGVEGEVKVRGTARPEDDGDLQRRYAAAVADALGWRPEVGRFHLFEVEIAHVASVRYGEGNDQFVTTWPPGREYVRRGTSATSVGDAEPVQDLLV